MPPLYEVKRITKGNAHRWVGVLEWESGDDLLSRARGSLSLALGRFTVLFGMGRGGTAPLWSPDVTGCGAVFGNVTELGLNGGSGKGKKKLVGFDCP